MEIMFSNGVRYSVEFIKLILVVVCILNIRVKKRVNIIFGISLIGVITVSYWFDISEYSVIYGVIAIGIFLMTLYKRRNIGFVILSYVGISIVDMLLGTVCVKLFSLTTQQMQDEFMLVAALNSISLILIIVLSVITCNMKKKRKEQKLEIYYPIMLFGGLSISIYLTCTQLVNLENLYVSYQNGLIISAIAITVVYSIICYLLTKNQAKNRLLKIENDMNQRLLKAQNEYYTMMLKKETETKMFRHDIKEHIMCIQMLYNQKKYVELGKYLEQMDTYTKELSPKVVTGNVYIDMILTDLTEQFPNVILEWIGKVPPLSIASMDICTLFYNLLKNSFETADRIVDKSVKIIVKKQGTNLVIIISNHYENLKQDEYARYISTKKERGHGYGLKNIEKCVERYEGSYVITTENGIFCTEIILLNVISE